VEIITEYQQNNKHTVKDFLSCYHVAEESLDEDDSHNINIIEIEGERGGRYIFGVRGICCTN
jgi:hypothetical protein